MKPWSSYRSRDEFRGYVDTAAVVQDALGMDWPEAEVVEQAAQLVLVRNSALEKARDVCERMMQPFTGVQA